MAPALRAQDSRRRGVRMGHSRRARAHRIRGRCAPPGAHARRLLEREVRHGSWGGAMSCEGRLRALLAKELAIPQERLSLQATLEELEVDSLRMIELAFAIEESFG